MVTFGSRAELSISLGKHLSGDDEVNMTSFRKDVDSIPFFSGGTRIDLGLIVARDQLFTYREVRYFSYTLFIL